ncbi:MAG: hypothetical protein OXI64_12855 [Defluviicoccus sp.]|nr:hypothetical protein [Defluviicoccus sp.]
MIELIRGVWDEFLHNRELRELQKKKASDLAPLGKQLDEAEDPKEEAFYAQDYFAVEERFDDRICALQAKFLRAKAERYLLPTPSFDQNSGNWRELHDGRWTLSLSALANLRESISEYERRRRERIQSWFLVVSGLIGAATGAMGALIGLIAISD